MRGTTYTHGLVCDGVGGPSGACGPGPNADTEAHGEGSGMALEAGTGDPKAASSHSQAPPRRLGDRTSWGTGSSPRLLQAGRSCGSLSHGLGAGDRGCSALCCFCLSCTHSPIFWTQPQVSLRNARPHSQAQHRSGASGSLLTQTQEQACGLAGQSVYSSP